MDELQEQATIVVIDDDPVMRLSCKKILSKVGFRVEAFEDGAKGLDGVARLKPALVVVDLKMPGISGIDVISRVREIDPDIVTVVITGYATVSTAVEAMKSGAYDFLPKPFSPDELRLIVNRGIERRNLLKESQRLEMERELLKRRFVTFVSHQLQSPLAAVHQYLEVMKQLGDSDDVVSKRREWLERCLARTDEMLEIIKDWLSLSKVESGFLAKERAKVDLKPIILNILKNYEERATEENVSLDGDLRDDAYFVHGDRHCLNVLFDNLVVNAIKYNKPRGKVTVSGKLVEGEVVILVADTGIGISEEHKNLLFSEFFRARGHSAQDKTGTGLGLAICKKIVSEMGGTIEVQSELGIGSTFSVHLPAYSEGVEEESRGQE